MSEYHRGRNTLASSSSDVTRQVFFPLTPEAMEYLDEHGTEGLYSESYFVGVDLEPYLEHLPELEAEIVYLLHFRKKNQKDVAKLLCTSQPTVSYRYRRAIEKLSYLMVLNSIDLHAVVATLPTINDKEKAIIEELFRTANQELVGAKFSVRQSSVKWIFAKTKRYLQEHEQKDPERWFRHYALFMLLDRNLRIRVHH